MFRSTSVEHKRPHRFGLIPDELAGRGYKMTPKSSPSSTG